MQILFIIPGDVNLPTGGYRYDRAIINEWQKAGINVQLISIKGNYPFPDEDEKSKALSLVSELPDADIAVVDGLLGGTVPDFMEALSRHMPMVALIHHPLCLENGISPEKADILEQSEKTGLAFTSAIITTSPATAKTVASLFNQADSHPHTVLPGVERGNIAQGSKTSTTNLLCVGSVIERKGHKTLLSSLAGLKHMDWHLDCIGMTTIDKSLFSEIREILDTHDMGDRVTFHGSVSEAEVEAAYTKADVFVLPSLYEGYGMAYAEAIVRGLPVIGTTAGAIPDTVPETCGLLVEPENIKTLANALETMIGNKSIREKYRKGALAAASGFPTWETSATRFASILRKLT